MDDGENPYIRFYDWNERERGAKQKHVSQLKTKRAKVEFYPNIQCCSRFSLNAQRICGSVSGHASAFGRSLRLNVPQVDTSRFVNVWVRQTAEHTHSHTIPIVCIGLIQLGSVASHPLISHRNMTCDNNNT